MRTVRALALASALLAVVTPPVHAQTTTAVAATSVVAIAPAVPSATGFWWGSLQAATNAAVKVVDFVVWPFSSAWGAVTRLVVGAEHEVASHVSEFAQTLRSDYSRFEHLARRAGFHLAEVNMRATLVPEIGLVFEPAESITPEEKAKLREEVSVLSGPGTHFERMVLLALMSIDEHIERVRPVGFRVESIEMALVAILPDVTVNFARGEP